MKRQFFLETELKNVLKMNIWRMTQQVFLRIQKQWIK